MCAAEKYNVKDGFGRVGAVPYKKTLKEKKKLKDPRLTLRPGQVQQVRAKKDAEHRILSY